MVNLFGDEIELDSAETTTKLVKKLKEPKKAVTASKKSSNKGISTAEKINLITQKVKETLGKQIDKVITIRDKQEFHNYISDCVIRGVVAIDTETNNSLDPVTCKLMGLCLYSKGLKQAYIPVNHINYETGELLPNQLTEQDIKEELQRFLDSETTIIMHNAKFDFQVIKCTCGIEIMANWDTEIAARLLDENEKAGLKYQYITHIDPEQEKYSIEELFEKELYSIFPPDVFALYAATDSYMTYRLYAEYQKPRLEDKSCERLLWVFNNVEMPLIRVTAQMELDGIEVDLEYAHKLSLKYHKHLDVIDAKISDELAKLTEQINKWRITPEAVYKEKKINKKGETVFGKSKSEQLEDPINLGSPTQLAILFYDILKVPVVNPSKPRGTGEEEIDAIYKKTKLPICQLLIDRRGVVKLLSTYIDNIPELSKIWKDHRLRTHFNQCGTDTGRYSSGGAIKYIDNDGNRIEVSGVNLQNIPSHNKEIRLMFKARDGYEIIGSDFSAQEPRLTASYADEPKMLNAYRDGKDLYAVIAQSMYHNNYEDNLEFYPEGTHITLNGKEIVCGKGTHKVDGGMGKERRGKAKILLLAILYGMGSYSAGELLGITPEEAQKFIDNFFKGFPHVKKWIDETKKSVRELGYVEDWAGRRRRLPDVNLKPYDVFYKDKKEVSDFNPFLICSNRIYKDKDISYYEEQCSKIRGYAKYNELKQEALKKGIIINSNTTKIATAERQCVNARVQGGSATLTKLAMINIYNDKVLRELGFRLLVTVHDEVLGECPKENAEQASKRLVQVMVDTAKPYIKAPMSCDPYVVSHWYEDEMTAVLQKEFEQNQKDMDDIQALETLCKNHSELTEESIHKVILSGKNLVV